MIKIYLIIFKFIKKMKIYSLLILLCILKTLICDKEDELLLELKDALKISLPYIKSFRPESLTLAINANFSHTDLNSNNIQFKFDEFGLLHIKFVNITGQVKAKDIPYKTANLFARLAYTNYTVELNNINWEQTYAVSWTKTNSGKYDVKFKNMTESSISFKVIRVTLQKETKGKKFAVEYKIKKLDYTPLKSYLKKISGLIIETFQKKIK